MGVRVLRGVVMATVCKIAGSCKQKFVPKCKLSGSKACDVCPILSPCGLVADSGPGTAWLREGGPC